MNKINLNLLLKTLASKFQTDIVACQTVYDAWKFFEDRFLGDKDTQLVHALASLHAIKYCSVDEYVSLLSSSSIYY